MQSKITMRLRTGPEPRLGRVVRILNNGGTRKRSAFSTEPGTDGEAVGQI